MGAGSTGVHRPGTVPLVPGEARSPGLSPAAVLAWNGVKSRMERK